MIDYDKRKFDAYIHPGVFEAEFNSSQRKRKKQSCWKRLLAKLRSKKYKKKKDEYEKGRERVKDIINR